MFEKEKIAYDKLFDAMSLAVMKYLDV